MGVAGWARAQIVTRLLWLTTTIVGLHVWQAEANDESACIAYAETEAPDWRIC